MPVLPPAGRRIDPAAWLFAAGVSVSVALINHHQ